MVSIPLSLYVHLPWCVRKCPYCDFNSHEARGALPVDAYVEALLVDLERDRELAEGRPLTTVFFGGGTPSLLPPAAIARILDGVAARVAIAVDAEVTLEANPGAIERGRFAGYRAAGINRVSIGAQSFDDAILPRIGRIHGADEARAAVREARAAGIGEINIDLMYALPGQTLAGALADLDAALALAPTHVSHYQLTLEPNTRFARRPPPLPDEDAAWDMQEACQQRLAAAGYPQYEVSAYAAPAHQCRHNLGYWRFGDYLGIGAGAHGKLTDAGGRVWRTRKPTLPKHYLEAAQRPGAIGTRAPVDPAQLPFEYMLNALRLREGFTLADFSARTGLPAAAIEATLADARARGWLETAGTGVVPSAEGRRLLNDLIALFMV